MTATLEQLFASPDSDVAQRDQRRQLLLRSYQRDAVDAILREFQARRATLLVSATGTGKTVIFAHVIDSMPRDKKVLVLAHREELLEQSRWKIHDVTGERPTMEKANFVANPHARIVVSSIQSQCSKRRGVARRERFDPKDFGLLIIDEAHRSAATSYRETIDYYVTGNPDIRTLGATATPDRHDQQALREVFESVAYCFPVSDAVDQAWLVPIRQRSVVVTALDYSSIKTVAGDLHGAELAAILEFEKVLHEMALPVLELARGRQTLVFCASVAHADRFAEVLNRHRPFSAACITGDTDENNRRMLFADFAARKFQVLCNCAIATEGTDIPGVEVIVMARPTKSRALFEQMIGRGLRPHDSLAGELGQIATKQARRAAIDASEKPYCEVVDFVGNCGKHKLITVTDVLGGKYSAGVREKAARRAQESADTGVPVDVAELLKLGKDELDAAERRKQECELQERMRRQHIKAASEYRTNEVDPFDLYDIKPPRVVTFDKLPRATEAQVDFLRRYGIEINAAKTTRGEAGRIISEIRGRITPKQAKVLERVGYTRDEIRNLSVGDASRLIDRVKLNGWVRPVVVLAGVSEGEL